MAEVIIAKNAGFCFGVKRATDTLEAAVNANVPGRKIYTLGHLIHNDIYNRSLMQRGVVTIGEEDIARVAAESTGEAPSTVFIRAHGITKELDALLAKCKEENPYFEVVDCTCPYVKKIHRIADENGGEGKFSIVLGNRDHPEVKGIVSHFEGECHVFGTADEIEGFFVGENSENLSKITKNSPIMVAQTTQKLSEWHKSQKVIKKLCTNPIIFDTICSVTETRQTEAKELAQQCDLMIVIGGKDSSNSAKLAEICRAVCPETYWIQDVSDIEKLQISPAKRVGIAAGASTPAGIIEEVYKKMSENFEAMLEESLNKTLNTGDTVTGYVTFVSNAEIQLDVGYKVTGIIKAEQITDDPSVNLKEMFKVGDEVEAFVIRVSDIEGIAELSKKRTDSDKCWKEIENALESKEILEGKVIEAVKGGVIVLANNNRVFIPGAHTGIRRDGDLSVLVGQTVKFRVIEVKGRRAYGSIRDVAREERQAKEAAFWATVEEGKQYTGTVKSMTTYGAFVDIGGVDGMVHITELSWKRIKSPAEVVAIGDTIEVYVKALDVEKKRISLGYKTEATNPWKIFADKYAVGDVAPVKIVSMMPFGAFAEIVDGVDGLIHISQIALEKIAKPADVLEIGQVVDAKITEIDFENNKVSLSIRALLEEAKAAEEAMPAEEVAEEAVEAADAE
ncbi:MAG: 4-hydroxy-3-methylbut-2-enyl diphosphate reductase [Clostridia bacterium]|nr:4-hydroxy-3-methylbut-2-enyl diphosphate reductase [Clostridia bacterium]